MKTNLRILLLEDDATDAELIAQGLKSSGFSFRLARIETESDLRRELERDTPDLILSDHGLPSFDGFKALEIVRVSRPTLPFLFVRSSPAHRLVAKMRDYGAAF